MKIAYFVHDLMDPAVKKRVCMYRTGGAEVLITGFCRGAVPDEIDGIVPHDLGQTVDGRLISRFLKTFTRTVTARRLAHRIQGADIIVARNLEMLAIAQSVRGWRVHVPIVYECLDIHRVMLSKRIHGVGLRAMERYFSQKTAALITSSPAFVENYFALFLTVRLPVILVENKVFSGQLCHTAIGRPNIRSSGPWQIGWFGAIRCLKSFKILAAATRRLQGRLNVVIRGRPAYSEFPDFAAMVAAEPFISFHGAYRNPEDLQAIYQDVDFAWVVDFFEEGLNSEWLLPNRLYESGWAGTVPIARNDTMTGQWLSQRSAGVRLSGNLVDALVQFFSELNRMEMETLADGIRRIDRGEWICTPEDCRALIARFESYVECLTPRSE